MDLLEKNIYDEVKKLQEKYDLSDYQALQLVTNDMYHRNLIIAINNNKEKKE